MGVHTTATTPNPVVSDLVQKTLEGVNKLRNAVGLGNLKYMPQGHMGDSDNCPIARAVKDIFDSHGQVSVSGAQLGYLDREDDAEFIKVLKESGIARIEEGYDEGRVAVHIAEDFSGTFDEFVTSFDNGEIEKLIDQE